MDKVSSASEAALGGIQRNMRRLQEAASDVTKAAVDRAEPSALAEPLVRALEAQRAIEASAVTLRRVNDALDSLLDALG